MDPECRVELAWTRDGQPSGEKEADDWGLAFAVGFGTGASRACASYRLYGVSHLASPADWVRFLADRDGGSGDLLLGPEIGPPNTSSICSGRLRRDRVRSRIMISVSTEGTSSDELLEVTMPAAAALAELRRIMAHLANTKQYYLDASATGASDDEALRHGPCRGPCAHCGKHTASSGASPL